MTCYIYVIGTEDGPVKVGISAYPRGRLATLQTGSSVKLDLLHLRPCRDRIHALWHEETFHLCHAETRLVGEWFDMPSDLAIESVDCSFDYEDMSEQEALWEYQAAQLNIWQAA